MQQVKSFDDYSPWVDSMETKSQLDKIAFLSVVVIFIENINRGIIITYIF